MCNQSNRHILPGMLNKYCCVRNVQTPNVRICVLHASVQYVTGGASVFRAPSDVVRCVLCSFAHQMTFFCAHQMPYSYETLVFASFLASCFAPGLVHHA